MTFCFNSSHSDICTLFVFLYYFLRPINSCEEEAVWWSQLFCFKRVPLFPSSAVPFSECMKGVERVWILFYSVANHQLFPRNVCLLSDDYTHCGYNAFWSSHCIFICVLIQCMTLLLTSTLSTAFDTVCVWCALQLSTWIHVCVCQTLYNYVLLKQFCMSQYVRMLLNIMIVKWIWNIFIWIFQWDCP